MPFQDCAKREHLGHIIGRPVRHEAARAFGTADQILRFQPPQRFAHRRTRYAAQGRKLFLAKRVARGPFAPDDPGRIRA
jgi:hypothetical protein